jgi:hypothetical protein
MMEQTSYKITRIDFYSDWIEYLRNELIQMGYNVDSKATPEVIATQFLNVRHRLLPKIPRKVLVSREFHCPSHLQSDLKLFREKVEKGEDLYPHLSRKIKEVKFNDGMLNDWGVQHFHLGSKTITSGKDKGLIEGNNQILFVRVTKNVMYFIDVKDHKSWADKDVIEIIHSNWPESIAEYRVPPQSDLLPSKLNADDISQVRNAGINVRLALSDGTVYMALGGGYMLNRLSLPVAITHQVNAKHLIEHENSIKNNIQEMAIRIKNETGYEGHTFEFSLFVRDEEFFAKELNSNFILPLFPIFYPPL